MTDLEDTLFYRIPHTRGDGPHYGVDLTSQMVVFPTRVGMDRRG